MFAMLRQSVCMIRRRKKFLQFGHVEKGSRKYISKVIQVREIQTANPKAKSHVLTEFHPELVIFDKVR